MINFNFYLCGDKSRPVLTFGQPQFKGEIIMADVNLTNEQKVQATLTPVTLAGKPAKVDGKPTWTVQSGDGTVVVADDGLSAFLVSGNTAGDTAVLVEADADLGTGVDTISAQITMHVTSPNAANLGLTIGAPVPK